MAWVAVNKNGVEYIFENKPKREGDEWIDAVVIWGNQYMDDGEHGTYWSNIELPKGSIEKLIGCALTWEDEPVLMK